MNSRENALKDLWLTYKLYGEVSRAKGVDLDTSEYATNCTNGFLEYVYECSKSYPNWLEDIEGVIRNQIRIYSGFIDIYNKPVKVDKVTQKTRWSV